MHYVSFNVYDQDNKWRVSLDVPANDREYAEQEVCKFFGVKDVPEHTLVVGFEESE